MSKILKKKIGKFLPPPPGFGSPTPRRRPPTLPMSKILKKRIGKILPPPPGFGSPTPRRRPPTSPMSKILKNKQKKDRKMFAPAAWFRVTRTPQTFPNIADVEIFEKQKQKKIRKNAPDSGFWVTDTPQSSPNIAEVENFEKKRSENFCPCRRVLGRRHPVDVRDITDVENFEKNRKKISPTAGFGVADTSDVENFEKQKRSEKFCPHPRVSGRRHPTDVPRHLLARGRRLNKDRRLHQ